MAFPNVNGTNSTNGVAKTSTNSVGRKFPDTKTLQKAAEQLGISVEDLKALNFDFKFSIFGNSQTLKAEKLNLNGELKAYKPLSTLKGLEFLSIYEKFLISNGILIQNNEGYISKFKSDIQNNEIIFNNSVKFSDIVSNILINK